MVVGVLVGAQETKVWPAAVIAGATAGGRFARCNAFDPLRTGVLLIGGDKTGNDRWYQSFVPVRTEDRL